MEILSEARLIKAILKAYRKKQGLGYRVVVTKQVCVVKCHANDVRDTWGGVRTSELNGTSGPTEGQLDLRD